MGGTITEPNARQPFHGKSVGFSFRHMPDFDQSEHDIAEGGEMGKQIEALEHHASHCALVGQFPFAQAMPAAVPCHVTNCHIIENDFPSVKILKQVDAT